MPEDNVKKFSKQGGSVELGELEFKPEHFKNEVAPNGYIHYTSGIARRWMVSVVNARLIEVLSRAPTIESDSDPRLDDAERDRQEASWTGRRWRCRLVCTEELEPR